MCKKMILMISFLMFTNMANAENIIYKCISDNGDVSYVNINSKSSSCKKTDLAGVDKFVSIERKKVINNNQNVSHASMQIFNEEQKNRDSKRLTILSQELAEEENQLIAINKMLKNLENTKSTDLKQIQELSTLQNNHNKNISSLKKELKIKENIVNTTLKIEKAYVNDTLSANNNMKSNINQDNKK